MADRESAALNTGKVRGNPKNLAKTATIPKIMLEHSQVYR
jgi:hypothetical protein